MVQLLIGVLFLDNLRGNIEVVAKDGALISHIVMNLLLKDPLAMSS